MTDNKNLPAFPDPRRGAEQALNNQYPELEPAGLTKREYIAAMCLQGLMTQKWFTDDTTAEDCAKFAVIQADALLLHLENTAK